MTHLEPAVPEGSMSKIMSRLKRCMLPAIVIFLLVIVVYLYMLINELQPSASLNIPSNIRHLWLPYKLKEFKTKAWLESTCLHTRNKATLESLPDLLAKWKLSEHEECRDLYSVFTNILTVSHQFAAAVIPPPYEDKVNKWLGFKPELMREARKQSVLFLFNDYTKEQNSYNPIRSKRPMSVPVRPEREYVDELSKNTSKSCDFCNYKTSTAEDVFGRIENRYSYSASNTFKLDKWHGLFLMKTHHPLNWSRKQFMDLMLTSQQWFEKAYDYDNKYQYPSLVWDLLPHAGASQVHPHVHGFLDTVHYQGAMENWKQAALKFNTDFPEHNYFSSLVEIHSVLGLTVTHGTAIAFANLVPKKENEIVVISEKANSDFYELLYFVYRAYIDEMQQLCFSSGVAFPSMTKSTGPESLPVIARLVTRGAVADIRSDISSLELFVSTNANTDPYRVIEHIQAYLKKNSQAP